MTLSQKEVMRNGNSYYFIINCVVCLFQHLLELRKHEYILDSACVQFEPNDPNYIRVSGININCKFVNIDVKMMKISLLTNDIYNSITGERYALLDSIAILLMKNKE